MSALDTSKWEQHEIPTEDIDPHQLGEPIPNMQVEARLKTQKGNALHLKCDACDTNFVSQIWEGGINTCIRDNALHAQCPACGCSWDGTTRRFFSIALVNTRRVVGDLCTLTSMEAENIQDAMRMLISTSDLNLSQYGLGQRFAGVNVEEVGFRNHTIHVIRSKYVTAVAQEDPRANEIREDTDRDYTEFRQKIERWDNAAKTYAQIQHSSDISQPSNAFDAFMAAMQKMTDQDEERQPVIS